MSPEAVFFVLLAAVVVNLVVMAALIVAPVVDRRRTRGRRTVDPRADSDPWEAPVPRHRTAGGPAPAPRTAPPARPVARIDFPARRDVPGGPGAAGVAPTAGEAADPPASPPLVGEAADPPASPPLVGEVRPSPVPSGEPEHAGIDPELRDADGDGARSQAAEAGAESAAEAAPEPAAEATAEPAAEPSTEALPAQEKPARAAARGAQATSTPLGRAARTERAGRKFRIPAHDDPRTSKSIQSFLNRRDGEGDVSGPPAAPRPRPSRDGARGTSRGGRATEGVDGIWPVDPLTGLGNRVAWNALVAAEEEWLGPGDPAAVVVLEVDVIARGNSHGDWPASASDGALPGHASSAGAVGPERRASDGATAGHAPGHGRGAALGAAGLPIAASAPGAAARPGAAAGPGAPGPAAWMPALAGALRLELRSSDRLARLGPGLVAGLLVGTTGEQALVVLERLRVAVESSLVARRSPLRLRAGVADVRACGGIDAALDAALESANRADAPTVSIDAPPTDSPRPPAGFPPASPGRDIGLS